MKFTQSIASITIVCSLLASSAVMAHGHEMKETNGFDHSHRSEANQQRDEFRQPFRTLEFFGIEKDQKVVEIMPGGGWYSEILAPMLKEKGQFVAAHHPSDSPSSYRKRSRAEYEEKLDGNENVYGNVVMANFDPKAGVDNATRQADLVLTFRGLHGLQNSGDLAAAFGQFNQMLRPGGALGIVQHQAPEGHDPIQTARLGYLPKSHVVAVAKAAGFDLVAEAYFHNNPKDTIIADGVSGGVWTLPPRLRTEEKEKYADVGESNRMTLLFHKR